jgi:hypothetical protein
MSAHIGITIAAYDQASKTITAVAGQMEALGQQTQVAGNEVAQTGRRFMDFNRVMETATGLILRDVIRGFTQATVDAFHLGAQIGTLRASFDALQNNVGATELSLEALRQATRGMVSDVDLLQAANKAMSMRFPVEQLDQFFDAAIRVGKSMGLTATHAIDDFTVAIGRQQPKILDNFGIILQQTDAYDEYARILGKTVETLTDSERQTAFATVAIRKLMDQALVLGPLGQLAPILEGVMPLVGSLAASLIPSLITQVGGVTAVLHGLNVAVKALMGPVGWAILGISALAAALATDFLSIRTALTNLTKDYQTRFAEQTTIVQDAYQEQLDAIDRMVGEADDKYRSLEADLDTSYNAQLTAAQQAWLDLIAVTTSGWDNVVKQYDVYYDRQLADLDQFYDARLARERAYLDAVQGARREDLDALELQYLKERQAIEASEHTHATKQYYLERLEQRYTAERSQLSEDYRVKELAAEQQFNEA